MFLRTESPREFMRWYPVITTLVIIHIVFYVFSIISNDFKYLLIGQNYWIAVDGEYWRLVTPIFLHLSLLHLIFNTFSLILFGPPLERMLGKTKFILSYLFMGIMGNVASLYLADLLYTHAGASGAIYGLFGLYFFMIIMRPELLDPQSKQIVIVFIAIGAVMTFARTGINIYAHIFGFMAGLGLGPIILNRINRNY